MPTEEELLQARRKHAESLQALGFKPYPNDFRSTLGAGEGLDREASRKRLFELIEAARQDPERFQALPTEADLKGDEEEHWLFGRVVAKRGPFIVIRTPWGDAQALVRTKPEPPLHQAIPQKEAAVFALLDLADHVAVRGPLIRTRTGDFAVHVRHYEHVSKALRPPPDKWHGMSDIEKRYRERYVDLFSNPDVALVFRARSFIVREIRRWLDERGFLEVETPLLHPLRGGATARPFETHHNALDMKLYLRIAPELYLKRLLVGGFDRVYEIGRAFRNEGISTRHNPEFTILELYQAYATYEDLIILTESMLRDIDLALRRAFERPGRKDWVPNSWWENRPFDLEGPFARIDLRDAVLVRIERGKKDLEATPFDDEEGLGLSREILNDPQALPKQVARAFDPARLERRFGGSPLFARWIQAKAELERAESHGELVFALFEKLVEPDLSLLFRSQDGKRSRPVFITGYPFEVSPLARRSDEDPRFTDRFELYVDGKEIANAFSELNDPDDQAARFEAQLQKRARGDEEAMDFDADYIRALAHGMPPAGGLGIGIDRLVMALLNQASIRDVLLFPLLRPEASPR